MHKARLNWVSLGMAMTSASLSRRNSSPVGRRSLTWRQGRPASERIPRRRRPAHRSHGGSFGRAGEWQLAYWGVDAQLTMKVAVWGSEASHQASEVQGNVVAQSGILAEHLRLIDTTRHMVTPGDQPFMKLLSANGQHQSGRTARSRCIA